MSSSPKPNPNVPQIPQPQAEPGALAYVAQALKQGMDSLGGNRGKPTDRAVTFNDLITLGLFDASTLNAGTIAVGAIGAGQLAGNPRTIAAVPTGVVLATGLSLSVAGTLAPNWQGPAISHIGAGLTVATAGTLSALVAATGAGLALNSGTVSLGTIAASSLMGNGATAGAVPTAVAVGANLTLSTSGTLSASNPGTGTITGLTITASAFLNGGSITGTGTISSPTLAASSLIGNSTTAGSAAAAIALGAGLVFSGTSLAVGTLAYSNLPASADIRTLSFSLIGKPPSGQVFPIALTQAGTLLANGGTLAVRYGTNPTATQTLLVKTEHLGTVTTQGTITISTGGSVTAPAFSAAALAAGDSVDIVNQATADTAFADWSFGLQVQMT